MGKEKRKNDIRRKMLSFIASFFPGTFSNSIARARVLRELDHSHVLYSLIASASNTWERFLAALDIIGTIVIAAFVLTLLLDLQYPSDNGQCAGYLNKADCMAAASIFNPSESKCEWITIYSKTGVAFDECAWIPPKVNMFTLLQIVLLVIFTSVPLNFLNDFLIENVLRAPTPTALNEQGELELLTGRFYKGMAQTVNNIGTSIMAVVSAPTSSTSLQNDTDNSRRQTKESMKRTSDRKRGMLMNSVIGSHTDDDDRRTTEVPYDLENSSVRKSGIGNVNSGAVVPSGLSGRRHSKVKFFDLTILTPKEFDLRYRVSCDAYIETNGVTHIENRLTSKYYRHARLTAKRLGVDVEKILDPPYVSNTNQSFTEKIMTGFQELDVDLTPISQIVPLAYQTEDCAQELINTLQFLETDLIKQRNLIMNGGRSSLTSKKNFNLNKDMKKIEEELCIFDLKWGLRDIREEDQKNLMYQQISKPKTFIAEKVAKSYLAAKQVLDSPSTLSDHQIGSNIIGLFVTDMLGVENVRSRCYHKKHKRDFKSHRAMSIQIKLLVCLLLIGVYGFCISICLSYGANKNSIWKDIWIIIVSLKCIFDLSVKEMLMSVIIGYGIPNTIFIRTIT